MEDRLTRMKKYPQYWLNIAEQYKRVVDILYSSGKEHISDAVDYNAATALELAGKAILVRKFQKLPKSFMNHKLLLIYKNAGVRLNDDLLAVILFYEKVLSWYGRYPIPRNDSDYNELIRFYDEEMSMPGEYLGGLKIITVNPQKCPSEENFTQIWNLAYEALVSTPRSVECDGIPYIHDIDL